LYLGGGRSLIPPVATIANINIFKDARLGLSAADRRRLRPRVAFAIEKILRSTKPFCSHPGDRLYAAVAYLEDCEPRLAQCDSSWGACALLSRSIHNRQSRRTRATARAAAAAAAAATAASPAAAAPAAAAAAATAATGDDGDAPAQAAHEEQLEQRQVGLFNQLE